MVNYYNVTTEEGVTYHVFAENKLEAAAQVADCMDPHDEVESVYQVL